MRRYFSAYKLFFYMLFCICSYLSGEGAFQESRAFWQKAMSEEKVDKQYMILQEGVSILEKIDIYALEESSQASIFYNKALFYQRMGRTPLVLANLLNYLAIYPRDNQVKIWVEEIEKELNVVRGKSYWYDILFFIRRVISNQELLRVTALSITLGFLFLFLYSRYRFVYLRIFFSWFFVISIYLVLTCTLSYYEPSLAVVNDTTPILADPTHVKNINMKRNISLGSIVYVYPMDQIGGWTKVSMQNGQEGYVYEKVLLYIKK